MGSLSRGPGTSPYPQMKEYSPFTPGHPAPVELFVGRRKEVEELLQKAQVCLAGRLQTVFMLGERGIGKSSLAAFVRYLAEREQRILGLHVFLGGVFSLEEMTRRIFERLLRENQDKPWYEKVYGLFQQHVRQVGLFGVTLEFSPSQEPLQRLVSDFVPALRNILANLRDEKDGILLVLDDINGLAESRDFANWIKSVVDEIATSGRPVPLFLVIVGLPERHRSLVNLNPSLGRIFNIVSIPAWSKGETREFFKKAFASVNTTMTDTALDLLAIFSGGLPTLAHEIGEATFQVDTDRRIDDEDASLGIRQAAEVVGRKYLEPRVYEALRSPRYRSILRKIARADLPLTFARKQAVQHLTAEEKKVFDNFLRRMIRLGVLRSDPESGPGAYRFVNDLHWLYMRIEAERSRQTAGIQATERVLVNREES